MGADRELKWAVESYWSSKTTAAEMQAVAARLRRKHWTLMKAAGVDVIPSNDFSLYDHALDTAVMLGAVPARFRGIAEPLMTYFAMARGMQDRKIGVDVPAMEMTKWFDTNYHYIVPELERGQRFDTDTSKLLSELTEARDAGVEPRPVLLGPVSFLMLSKMAGGSGSPLELLDSLLPAYEKLLGTLADQNVAWVQLDEPCLVLDLSSAANSAYRRALRAVAAFARRPRVLLATYFGPLRENLTLATGSGLDGLHVDLVRSPEQLDPVLRALPGSMVLSAGVVDGRNVWRADLTAAHGLVRRAVRALGAERVLVAPSCSLLHVPFDLQSETGLDEELKAWLAFAAQKVGEVVALAGQGGADSPTGRPFEASAEAIARRKASPRIRNAAVRRRVAAIDESMLRRGSAYERRAAEQQKRFKLPRFPTTTIGSFPQTAEVRRARSAWRAGKLADAEYQNFVRDEIRRCVEKQAAWGLDVLVHGEFERNDMVEFFGEQLEGFAFTSNGWVQSYGSRCVKPPILFGDVQRRGPMTVDIARYAQSLAKQPVKGMLTGPVTILQWSFVRDDQPRANTCQQVALALRDEVTDLEAAGISIVQVDEPAIREGLPLRNDERAGYLKDAVQAFRLATSGVRDSTQIHTHMCYSEFGPILAAIADMDADVLSIETSRSRQELLGDFASQGYPNQVGPGVYDIHSPRVPPVEEMVSLMERATRALPAERLWVNPDCGLKTRGWTEVEASLKNMVQAARQVRESIQVRA
jgi:5-methyltetrahydropteroyltriglutamate--homocysteine methyltransferase